MLDSSSLFPTGKGFLSLSTVKVASGSLGVVTGTSVRRYSTGSGRPSWGSGMTVLVMINNAHVQAVFRIGIRIQGFSGSGFGIRIQGFIYIFQLTSFDGKIL